MATSYETEYWRVRLPDGWSVEESDGPAHIKIRKSGWDGVMGVLVTDDEPSVWDRRGEAFHGQLYGRTGECAFEKYKWYTRWWTLSCGNVSLYVSYCSTEPIVEAERMEVDAIVLSLLPTSFERPLPPLFS